MKKILVTGGGGYIGSHTVVELIDQGMKPVVVDNLSNCSRLVFRRIEEITGVAPEFVHGDICDDDLLDELFKDHQFDAVIHFAGLKAVAESVAQPLQYYHNNIQGSLALFHAMTRHQCFKLVFSSSATVYGEPVRVPISEDFPLSATNPYGQTKLMIENVLRDLSVAENQWRINILRYFNPVSAHASGLIGEDPAGIPNNLVPYIAQVANGSLQQLSVFGGDYNTPDGTGIRDYIHVVDLSRAHLNALNHLEKSTGCQAFNIGTGKGYSVLEVIRAFEEASGTPINYRIEARRAGDVSSCYADPGLAERELNWKASHGLDRMMQDQWRWQSQNPDGYVA